MSDSDSGNGCLLFVLILMLGTFMFGGTPDLHDKLMAYLDTECVQPGQKEKE